MWVDITANDVIGSVNDPELAVALNAFRAENQGDLLPGIISDKVAEVRGRVRVRNRLADHGVPEELKSATVDLVIFDALARLSPELAKRRQHWHDEALKKMDQVSSGELKVSEPDSEVTQSPAPHFFQTRTHFSLNDQEGL
jgi:hypothetical protein